MSDDKQTKDLVAAALLVALVIIVGGIDYWIGQFQTTLELLEVAYGEDFGFFNNPMSY